MLYFNPNKENCTGCAACYSICPRQCISMVPDAEGFLYPVASDSCINCGMCERVCPIVNFKPKITDIDSKHAIAALSRDYQVWHRSSSGGAFSEICRLWSDNNTLIVGAAWDGLSVHHIGVYGYENIAPLCKSKYISSAIENIYIEVYKHLKKGNKVIFSGCPCQVDGLRHFLRKEFANLLLIDLICHGQGSPEVFRESMNVMSDHLNDQVVAYQFRSKQKVYRWDHLALIKTINRALYVYNDPYIQLFLSQNAIRPACGQNCRYRSTNRTGDITIADCKGLTKIFPNLIGAKQNYSTVVSNTSKGENILRQLDKTMKTYPCTIADVVRYNPLFAHQTTPSHKRDEFFRDFEQNPRNAIVKWTQPYKIVRISFLQKLYDVCPEWLRRLFLKYFRKI